MEILQASIILGVSGNLLIRGIEPGINILLWIALLAAAMTALGLRKSKELWNPQTISVLAALLFFASMFAFRDSFELLFLDSFAVLGLLAIIILPAQKIKVQAAGVLVYVLSGIWTGIAALSAPFFVLTQETQWNRLARNGLSGHLISVSKGILIALPLVLVFVGLLMSADADYESFIASTFTFDSENAIASIGFSVFLSWFALGYLRTAVARFSWSDVDTQTAKPAEEVKPPNFSITEHDTEEPVPGPKKESSTPKEEKPVFDWNRFDNSAIPAFLTFGKVETAVVLGLMNLVFFSFIIVQAPYLFGGMDLVQSTPDFKLAEYARRGVGELIDVSMLVLPILLAIHWLLRKEDKANEKVFRILAGVQIGLLFVIMYSAVQRLLLLTGSLGYGLTTFRFYAMFLLIFLALVFVWFGMTVLRGVRQNFAWGALWAGLFVIASLHFVNPDDFIVRTNVDLMKQGRSFDASYNSSLSADAVPALIESYSELSEGDKGGVETDFVLMRCRLDESDTILSWNTSRKNALSILKSKGIGCE